MRFDPSLVDLAAEAMAPLGTPTMRRMMGGATLYLDGSVYAIVDEAAIWFKADQASDAVWDAAGAVRFTYLRGDGGVGTMNYRRAPNDCYTDADAFRHWAGVAIEASRRAVAKKGRGRNAIT